MGFHIKCGSDEQTPVFCFNSSESPAWGGKHVNDLSAFDLVTILEFCQREGMRQGWNDSLQNRLDAEEDNPFHPDLLGGYPNREWKLSYWRGVKERAVDPIDGDINAELDNLSR